MAPFLTFPQLRLQGKITLVLVIGSMCIGGLTSLASFLLVRQSLIDQTHTVLAAEAGHEREIMELRLRTVLDQAQSLASNPVTANALADSMGRDTYLTPLLANQRLSLAAATIALADYKGDILAANLRPFSSTVAKLSAFDSVMRDGRPHSMVIDTGNLPRALLVALPVVYRLTGNVEGVVLLSIPFAGLLGEHAQHDATRLVDDKARILAGSTPDFEVLSTQARLDLPAPLNELAIIQIHERDRRYALQELDDLLARFILVGLVTVIGVVFLARRGARLISSPLIEVSEAAQQIAASGRPNVRLSDRGDDEFGRLTAAFNTMVTRLSESYAELETRVVERTRALSESESRLRYVMDATRDGVWDWDVEANRVTHNLRWCEMLGLGPESLVHDLAFFADRIHPDDREAVTEALRRCTEDGMPYSHEYRIRCADGVLLWVLDRGDVVERDETGRALRMVGSLSDITDRKLATEALRVRELYLRATLDNLPFLFWLKDADSHFLAVNKVFSDACGMSSPEHVVGLTDLEVWPRDLAEAYRADDREVIESRTEKAVEEPSEEGGQRGWIETYKRPVIAEDGTVLGTVGFARDITARKVMETALAESEQRWELSVRGANDGIWDWNVQTGALYFSERWLSMLGYTANEFKGHLDEWQALLHPDDFRRVMNAVAEHMSGKSEFYETEFRLRCKDGRYKWILSRGKAMFDTSGQPVRMSGSHTDITGRREAEARILERTEQLNAIFALSPDGFVSFDAAHRVRYVSPAFLRMTGLDDRDVIGMCEDDFSGRLAGLCIPQSCFPGITALRARQSSTQQVAERRHMIELDVPGKRVLEVGLRASESEVMPQLLYFRDITHETEVDRMKSEFLSTAAHELRTPMASIYGFAEMLMIEEFDAETRREFTATIHRHAQLMASIINELLDLARIEARRGKDFIIAHLDLRELLLNAVSGHKPPDGRMAPEVLDQGETAWVRVDRNKIQQCINNVISNAYKYSPMGGAVRIGLVHAARAGVGEEVGIQIQDEGIGLTPEQRARVCERFYRADTSGSIPGTGLGMSIVKEIMDLHGGHIEIDSQQGVGTTVTLWLPIDSMTP